MENSEGQTNHTNKELSELIMVRPVGNTMTKHSKSLVF
jgi:hypothetical protein